MTKERDNWRARASEYEQDLDRWRERAGDAEQEQASLNQRLEAALAAAAAAEAQREVWERATEEARTTAEQLETRVQAELQQLAHDRDNWRRGVSEYEQDRDRWRERAGRRGARAGKPEPAAGGGASRSRRGQGPARVGPQVAGVLPVRVMAGAGRLGYVRQFFVLRGSFDYEAYLALNSDVVAAGLHPLLHYIEHGAREGRVAEPLPSEASPRPNAAVPSGERPEAGATPDAIAAFLERSGLIDDDFYREKYPEVESSELTPAQHFCRIGWREGRRPNAYFDTEWYLRTYPDVVRSDTNPIWDYVVTRETRRPCVYFDPAFYASRYGLPATDGALADFLRHGKRGEWRDPVELFDTQFYLAHNLDVAASGGDPFLHYLPQAIGRSATPRRASARLSTARSICRAGMMSIRSSTITRPFCRAPSDAAPVPSPHPVTAADEVRRRVQPGPSSRSSIRRSPRGATSGEGDRVLPAAVPPDPRERRVVGQGLHGVAKRRARLSPLRGPLPAAVAARPRLLRPRRERRRPPSRSSWRAQQASTASASTTTGSTASGCSSDPLERFLDDPRSTSRSASCWANENWTRRWDGHDDEILIAQKYDPGYDVGARRRPAAALCRSALHPPPGPAAAPALPRRLHSRTPRDRIARWRELWEITARRGAPDLRCAGVRLRGPARVRRSTARSSSRRTSSSRSCRRSTRS